jgi:hypothetical protein
MTLHAWMKRLTFSFFIVAFALFWRGQKAQQAGDQSHRPYLWMGGAVLCVIAGSVGVRMRHTSPPEER